MPGTVSIVGRSRRWRRARRWRRRDRGRRRRGYRLRHAHQRCGGRAQRREAALRHRSRARSASPHSPAPRPSSGRIHKAYANQRRICRCTETSEVKEREQRQKRLISATGPRANMRSQRRATAFLMAATVRDHDQIDAQLAERCARAARVAVDAVAGLGLAQLIGAHQARVGGHHQRGVEEPGMAPDLGLAIALLLQQLAELDLARAVIFAQRKGADRGRRPFPVETAAPPPRRPSDSRHGRRERRCRGSRRA